MKALVHDGFGAIFLRERPMPRPVDPTDAAVRVTRSSICTSDLHIICGAVPRALSNAVVAVAAMYEHDQALPLSSMYGKNLIFKTGGVDAHNLGRIMDLIEQGRIDTSCLISRRFALNDILEAYRVFEAREDGCLKVVVTPWEDRPCEAVGSSGPVARDDYRKNSSESTMNSGMRIDPDQAR